MDTQVTKARVVLDYMEKKSIERLLDEHCVRFDGEMCDYKAGWSDEKIAEVLNAEADRKHFNDQHVKRMRQMLFGQLKVSPGESKKRPKNREAIAQLAARVKLIEDYLDSAEQTDWRKPIKK